MEQVATWAGWIMTVLGLITFVIKPIMSSFTKISDNLTSIGHHIELLTRDFEASEGDRIRIHDELKEHDRRLDEHQTVLTRHDAQIQNLFKEDK